MAVVGLTACGQAPTAAPPSGDRRAEPAKVDAAPAVAKVRQEPKGEVSAPREVEPEPSQQGATPQEAARSKVVVLEAPSEEPVQPGASSRAAGGDEPALTSRSMGHPRSGKLVGGVQLKPAGGIRILRPERAWATENTVFDLLDAVDRVRRKFKDAHTLLIGDLSSRRGGPLPPHQSHQSGRDVDVGLFFTDAPKEGLDHFAKFDARAFDAKKTWTLVAALIGPDANRPRVKHIFLDWEIQELLRREGSRAGLSRKLLDIIFQYPRGGGIVRHVEGHEGHMHVRFPCGRDDSKCTDFNPESVALQKVRRKCVKRRAKGKSRSKLQQLLAEGDDDKPGKAKGSADVHCFIVEYE